MLNALGVVPEEHTISEAQKRCWDALFRGIRRVEKTVLELECGDYGVSILTSSELCEIQDRLDYLLRT